MAKEKTGEIKKPEAAKSAGPAATEHKGPASHSGPSSSGGQSKGAVGTKVGCHSVSCKEKDTRANFCEEHFRQFKFGLITKTGEKVLDYERKFEHYQNWVRAQKNAKVA